MPQRQWRGHKKAVRMSRTPHGSPQWRIKKAVGVTVQSPTACRFLSFRVIQCYITLRSFRSLLKKGRIHRWAIVPRGMMPTAARAEAAFAHKLHHDCHTSELLSFCLQGNYNWCMLLLAQRKCNMVVMAVSSNICWPGLLFLQLY
jgi:hypothetical protein